MKIYQHRKTGEFIQQNLKGDYSFQYEKRQSLPKRLVENTFDWKILKNQ